MRYLIIFAFICMPLFSSSQLPLKEIEIPEVNKKEDDTVRVELQKQISELIIINEEGRELKTKTTRKLSEVIALIDKKIKDEANKEFQ